MENFFHSFDVCLYLDDIRTMPLHYTHRVKRAVDAIEILKTRKVIKISLDHDLGIWDRDDRHNGYMVACYIEEAAFKGILKRLEWHVHSGNPVGAQRMAAALKNADRYWSKQEELHMYRGIGDPGE